MPHRPFPLEALLENISDAVFLADRDGTIRYASPAATRILGFAAEEFVGRKIFEFHHPDDVQRSRAEYKALAAAPGRQMTIDLRARHKDGSWRWVESIRKNMLDDPLLRAVIVNYRDITARREAAARESDARKAAVLEHSLDAIVSIDHHGRIVEFNPAAEATFGYARSEVLGRDMCDLLIPPALRAQHRRGFTRYLATGEGPVLGRRVELPALRRGGVEFPAELTIIAIPGEPPLATAFIRDLAARRELEAERRRHRYDQFLVEFTQEFTRYYEPAELFPALARRCAEVLGEWCSISSIVPGDPHLRIESIYHADPAKVARVREALHAFPVRVDDPILVRLFAERRPFVMSAQEAEAQRLTRDLPAAATAFTELGVTKTLAVPIYVEHRPMGIFSIGSETDRRWDDEDLRLASLVADRAGWALKNARLIEGERAARQEAERTADRTARLQRVTAALSEALTLAQVADVILDQGVGALGAHAGSVSVLNRDGETIDLVRAVGYPQPLVAAWQHAPLSARVVAAEAVRSHMPLFFASRDAVQAHFASTDPKVFLPFEGARAIIPLVVGREVMGIMSFNFPAPRALPQSERDFIMTLARECAMALERARLYEHERTVAETLQRSLLPAETELPNQPGIRIAARYLPATPEAKIGGDWYDALALPDGRLGLVIGDVAGHGLQAAVVMGRLRNALRAYAMEPGSPADLMRRLSHLVEPDDMATLIYLVLDPVGRTATYANAGHPPPLLVTPDGRSAFLPGASIPLCRLRAPYEQFTAAVPDGSTLVLYTDGLVEDHTQRTIDDGLGRLRAVVEQARGAAPQSLVDRIVSAVFEGRSLDDDVAVLVVSLDAFEAGKLTLHMPAVPESAQAVRRSLWRWLTAADVDPHRIQEITTAVGEACNNAIEHAYSAAESHFTLEAAREAGQVAIVVRDEGRWRSPRPGRGGLGLAVMRDLMDAVEIERRPDGTTVRLRRRLHDEARA